LLAARPGELTSIWLIVGKAGIGSRSVRETLMLKGNAKFHDVG
jgi:hypothetical protein